MAILSLQNISIAFGSHPILKNVTFQIERKERVCLLGINGAGKSTLMKIVSGELIADEGEVILENGTKVAMLQQDVPTDGTGTVFDFVVESFGDNGKLVAEYYKKSQNITDDNFKQISELQHKIESLHCTDIQQSVLKSISKVSLLPNSDFSSLSGGMKRRVLLAKALAKEPDLLLLDEPTNHLDVDSITWIEDFLSRYSGAVLFITHDRVFLKKMATRIIEIDRGNLSNWDCTYEQYLERKESQLESEEKQWSNFDKKLAEEEKWIRRGIKARRTRNEGRVRALKKMREERKKRRDQPQNVSMNLQQANKSGRIVIDAKNVNFAYSKDTQLIRDFSIVIQRGERIGIMGANGTGKTTLLNLLLGKLKPQSGTITLGTNLKISYFDQLRSQLDDNLTVWENVTEEGDFVTINGTKRHVIGYLRDFLFPAERAKTPLKNLSGGEKNRLLLAKLFTHPSNVIVFDEPTNDLDINTLELLEDLLGDYDGTVLLVSHDREFLNNVVTCTLAFEPNGGIKEYSGGYDEWVINRPKITKNKKNKPSASKVKSKKYSIKYVMELEKLPQTIESLEIQIEKVNTDMADPKIFSQPGAIKELKDKLEILESDLNIAYSRWDELDRMINGNK